MRSRDTLVAVRALLKAWAGIPPAGLRRRQSRLKVFLDTDPWFAGRLRSEIDFVTDVADRREADVCITATPDASDGDDRCYRVHLVGTVRSERIEASVRLHVGSRPAVGPRADGPGRRRPVATRRERHRTPPDSPAIRFTPSARLPVC